MTTSLPQEVLDAWADLQKPAIFTTVDAEGMPNAIYASSVSLFDDATIVIADNYFDKTKANILNGSRGSILFMSKDRKNYQVKGSITYHTEGAIFEDMKQWNPARLPGHAAAALHVEQVFSGAKQLA